MSMMKSVVFALLLTAICVHAFPGCPPICPFGCSNIGLDSFGCPICECFPQQPGPPPGPPPPGPPPPGPPPPGPPPPGPPPPGPPPPGPPGGCPPVCPPGCSISGSDDKGCPTCDCPDDGCSQLLCSVDCILVDNTHGCATCVCPPEIPRCTECYPCSGFRGHSGRCRCFCDVRDLLCGQCIVLPDVA
ncbi:uncharacterized protein [Antedon mediterranea]|uniref:uncharacterized protein isoform X2 n=1 Tax=Antedon mediterranea TaxID=105859 RepID=UPI003AF60EDB